MIGSGRASPVSRRARGLLPLAAIAILIVVSLVTVWRTAAHRAALDQFERRGHYLARSVAHHTGSLLLSRDPGELTAHLDAVRSSAPDVSGIVIVDARWAVPQVRAHAGDVDVREGGVELAPFSLGVRVRTFRAPIFGRSFKKGTNDGVMGEVHVGLRQQIRDATEERRRRGQTIADHLADRVASNVLSGTSIHDVEFAGIFRRDRVQRALAGVAHSAPEVAGIAVRGRNGRVLARLGEPWSDDAVSGASYTESLRPVVVYRAAVVDETAIPLAAAAGAPSDSVAAVEVALHDSQTPRWRLLEDVVDRVRGVVRW